MNSDGHGIELERKKEKNPRINRIDLPNQSSFPSRTSATPSRMTFGNNNIVESKPPSSSPSTATLAFLLVTHRNPNSVVHNTSPDDSPNVPNALAMQDGLKAHPCSERMISKFVDMISSCKIRARAHAERTTRCVCSPKLAFSASRLSSEDETPQRTSTSAQARRIWVMKSCTAASSSRGLTARRWARVRERQRADVACGSNVCVPVMSQ